MASGSLFWVALLVAGVVSTITGLRSRVPTQRILAPLGVFGIATAARFLLADVVPAAVLLALGGISLAGVVYWSAQLNKQDHRRDVGNR